MKIGVVGLGLIGASIAMNLVSRHTVIGVDTDKTSEDYAQDNGIITAKGDMKSLRGCEVVFVAAPVDKTADVVSEVYEIVGDSAIITDVASVKGILVGQKGRIVGAHPMAGTQFSGVMAAKKGLFCGAYYFVVAYENTRREDIDVVKTLIAEVGAKSYEIDYASHDALVAKLSHLPHMVAYALARLEMDADKLDMAGSGFLDTTRIASSSPHFWSSVARLNKENILREMDNYSRQFSFLRAAIESDDYEKVERFFAEAKACRDKIVK